MLYFELIFRLFEVCEYATARHFLVLVTSFC